MEKEKPTELRKKNFKYTQSFIAGAGGFEVQDSVIAEPDYFGLP